MNLKEHLQFLAMMVPTMLLLAALTLSLAFPAEGPSATSVQLVQSAGAPETEAAIVHETDFGPVSSAPAR